MKAVKWVDSGKEPGEEELEETVVELVTGEAERSAEERGLSLCVRWC